MADFKDLYKLGQSEKGSISQLGQEIKIDLQLEDSQTVDVGTVFGVITDEDDDPIQDAVVKITDTEYNPLYHGITDEEGQYAINNIPSGEQYLIFASKDKYDLNEGIPFVMQSGQQVERNFALNLDPKSSDSLVAGEVLDNDNNPIDGATVRLFDNYDPDNPILIKTTHSNQYGQYAFFDVPQGLYILQTSKLGYEVTETTFVIDAQGQVRNITVTMSIDPITRKGTINGIITDKDDNPVVGAFVILFEVDINEEEKEILNPIQITKTNDEGLYLFEQVPQGDYKIKANKTIEEAI